MRISFLQPTQQFDGTQRLLSELQESLGQPEFNDFRFVVAFAKSGPLIKLKPALENWKQNGKSTQAIFGIDHFGTTQQALQIAQELFDNVYVTHTGGACTFHPKFYLFRGPNQARLFYGSHNLTVGGTETNLEAGVRLDLDLPEDERICNEGYNGWDNLLPDHFDGTKELTPEFLEQLVTAGLVLDESQARTVTMIKTSHPKSDEARLIVPKREKNPFKRLQPKPALPRPKTVNNQVSGGKAFPTPKQKNVNAVTSQTQKARTSPITSSDTLVIQINPHHNGEVFLSKLAVDQNQAFFGFPFTGNSTPKIQGKASYPQHTPDPIVNVIIYDNSGKELYTKSNFPLNTVFYEPKSEIRVTVSPDLRDKIEPFSVMIMRQSDTPEVDYDLEIFTPGSAEYQAYLDVCDQVMPSGGSEQSRKFGWL